jgi:hypothetical protein
MISPAALFTVILAVTTPAILEAQRGRAGQGTPATAKAAAPVDLTGYWVSVVTEDWRYRMVTPKKGDHPSIPLNAEGVRVADSWDPAKDEAAGEQCKAYGAAGVMRAPGRIHITWQDDNTLKVEADFGTQTRVFHFNPPPRAARLDYSNATLLPGEVAKLDAPTGTEASWQGYSAATWTIMGGTGNYRRGGNLRVVTTRLKPGYYWKNGMPYSGNAVLTEYFRVFQLPDKSTWIRLSQIVEDPEYLNQPYIVNYHFKKLPDGALWKPTPCSVK